MRITSSRACIPLRMVLGWDKIDESKTMTRLSSDSFRQFLSMHIFLAAVSATFTCLFFVDLPFSCAQSILVFLMSCNNYSCSLSFAGAAAEGSCKHTAIAGRAQLSTARPPGLTLQEGLSPTAARLQRTQQLPSSAPEQTLQPSY